MSKIKDKSRKPHAVLVREQQRTDIEQRFANGVSIQESLLGIAMRFATLNRGRTYRKQLRMRPSAVANYIRARGLFGYTTQAIAQALREGCKAKASGVGEDRDRGFKVGDQVGWAAANGNWCTGVVSSAPVDGRVQVHIDRLGRPRVSLPVHLLRRPANPSFPFQGMSVATLAQKLGVPEEDVRQVCAAWCKAYPAAREAVEAVEKVRTNTDFTMLEQQMLEQQMLEQQERKQSIRELTAAHERKCAEREPSLHLEAMQVDYSGKEIGKIVVSRRHIVLAFPYTPFADRWGTDGKSATWLQLEGSRTDRLVLGSIDTWRKILGTTETST